MKVLRGGEFAGGEARERFKAEAENAARLQHPDIVAVHDFGEEQGVCWFSLELITGRNLDEATRHLPLPSRIAAECLRRVALAVQHAHEAGVLHRDLKPSNIIMDAEGAPHIADFGIARRVEGTGWSHPAAASCSGPPASPLRSRHCGGRRMCGRMCMGSGRCFIAS